MFFNGNGDVGLNNILMLLTAFSWFKTCKCDYIKFKQIRFPHKRSTSVNVILPFLPVDGQWNGKNGQTSFKVYWIHKDLKQSIK